MPATLPVRAFAEGVGHVDGVRPNETLRAWLTVGAGGKQRDAQARTARQFMRLWPARAGAAVGGGG